MISYLALTGTGGPGCERAYTRISNTCRGTLSLFTLKSHSAHLSYAHGLGVVMH